MPLRILLILTFRLSGCHIGTKMDRCKHRYDQLVNVRGFIVCSGGSFDQLASGSIVEGAKEIIIVNLAGPVRLENSMTTGDRLRSVASNGLRDGPGDSDPNLLG